jgi:WD40 repeat protein
MQTHSDGEVWGLATADNSHVYTSGDDNKIILLNIPNKKVISVDTICNEARKAKRGGASSLTELPDSQCSRALAYNAKKSHLAVGHNDGTLTVRSGGHLKANITNTIATKNDSKEWIEAMSYSPDGEFLAVGSHDNNIYIYETTNYGLTATCKAHNSFIVSVDWSVDGKYIRSVCGAHELLFFSRDDGWKQDKSGGSNTVGV